MLRYRVNFFLFIFLVFISARVIGQTSSRENDPYSRFGIGTLQNGNNTVLQGMGNASTAFANAFELNSENPASYSYLKLTTYEAGAFGSIRTVATNDLDYTTGRATMSYLNIGIPIANNKAGISIGLKPVTHVYYDMADTVIPGGAYQMQRLFAGSGSISNLFVGAAYKYKKLSFGLNFGYMFGTIHYSTNLYNIDTSSLVKAYSSNFSQYTKIGGVNWKAGLLYEDKLRKDVSYRVGATLSLKQDLEAIRNEYWVSTYSLADTFIQDTAYSAQQLSRTVTMPLSYSLGIQFFNTDKWSAGIDYSSTLWNQFNLMNGIDSTRDSVANSTYKIAIGGEFTPNSSNVSSYWSRVTYRMGFYFGTDYRYLRNTTLNNYGMTIGCSLPIRRSTSHVHLALDAGVLGTKDNNLIKETYLKFSLGFSLNDKWFIKRRYE